MKLKLFLLTIISVFGLLLPVNSLAASTLSVRLGQPKSPSNQDNFKLTFVALDIANREIAVSCFKKGPLDGGYSQFDVTKNLIPGGNTDSCNVDSGILNSAGTYSFYVVAVAGADSVTSSTVSVDHNTSGPSTPDSYSKEKINDCDYKIKFRTANDGKTIKVELFRSDSLSIHIDSGSRVGTLSIAPNTAGEITNSIPVCSKEYFYAIRAVDIYENASGITGDNFTKVTTTTTTPTVVAGAQGAIAIGTGSQVTEGAGTEATVTPSVTGEPTAEPTPAVLGTQTSKYNYLRWVEAALLVIAVIFFLKSRKRA
jgi:hypothetical protein